jgi:hypothetical protein
MRARTGIAAAVLTVAAAAAAVGFVRARGEPRFSQPIAFDHARHVAEEMACTDCHRRAANGPYATLPLVATCMLCHAEAKGSHPDEPKIREYAAAGREIPWVRVNRLPGHVYFSHEAHVTYAEMDCAACHGAMKQATAPVTEPQIGHLTMARCMQCHHEKGVRDDCSVCHK